MSDLFCFVYITHEVVSTSGSFAMWGACSYLSSDCQLIEMLVSYRTVVLVLIVEYNGHTSFGDSCLSLLIYKLLQAIGPYLLTKIEAVLQEMKTTANNFHTKPMVNGQQPTHDQL